MKFQKQIAALVLCINKVVNETAPTKSHIKKIVTGEVKTVTKVTARKVKDKITYKKTPEANPLQNDEHTGQQTATSSTNQVNQNQNMVTEPSLPKSDSQRRTIVNFGLLKIFSALRRISPYWHLRDKPSILTQKGIQLLHKNYQVAIYFMFIVIIIKISLISNKIFEVKPQ